MWPKALFMLILEYSDAVPSSHIEPLLNDIVAQTIQRKTEEVKQQQEEESKVWSDCYPIF
jgi:hypothetical protein